VKSDDYADESVKYGKCPYGPSVESTYKTVPAVN